MGIKSFVQGLRQKSADKKAKKAEEELKVFSLKKIMKEADKAAMERQLREVVDKLVNYIKENYGEIGGGTFKRPLHGKIGLASVMAKALSPEQFKVMDEAEKLLGEDFCTRILAEGLVETDIYQLHKDGEMSLK